VKAAVAAADIRNSNAGVKSRSMRGRPPVALENGWGTSFSFLVPTTKAFFVFGSSCWRCQLALRCVAPLTYQPHAPSCIRAWAAHPPIVDRWSEAQVAPDSRRVRRSREISEGLRALPCPRRTTLVRSGLTAGISERRRFFQPIKAGLAPVWPVRSAPMFDALQASRRPVGRRVRRASAKPSTRSSPGPTRRS
jgi:hypothetical protein